VGAVTTIAFGDVQQPVAAGLPAGCTLLLATGGDDGTVRVWAVGSHASMPVGGPLVGHTHAVTSVAFGAWGGPLRLVTGGADGSVCLWAVGSWRVQWASRAVARRLDTHGAVLRGVVGLTAQQRVVVAQAGCRCVCGAFLF